MSTSLPPTVQSAAVASDHQDAGDWLVPYLRWTRVPSWFLSALIHIGLIVAWIALSQTNGCRRDIAVGEGEGFREVGLIKRPSAAEANESQEEQPEGPLSPREQPTELSEAQELVSESLTAPPVMTAPSQAVTLPILGGGPPESIIGTGHNLLQPTTAGSALPSGTPMPGSTSLFGVNDSGQRFVYVIDNSGSMEAHDALQAAKNELLRSVEALDSTQQFLVIFYNVQLTMITPRSGPGQMFQGSDRDRLDLSQQIAPISGDAGTDHISALREALKYHADVIFFLTDGGRPGLTTAELENITARNGGAARIHCIEFGDTPGLAEDAGNSLRRLANMNHGRYIYKDVRDFAR